MSALNELTALSPLDGRYRNKLAPLAAYFSEWALMRYRAQVEVEYLIALGASGIPQLQAFSTEAQAALRRLYTQLSPDDAQAIKTHEARTNHDVKALEYWLLDEMDKLEKLGIQLPERARSFVHFGLTSQDVNNTAIPLSLRDALHQHYLPALEQVGRKLLQMAQEWAHVPMLARTHGQPASPVTLGKEIAVYVERLGSQYSSLKLLPFPAKFGGATGNFNAHHCAYPTIDWVAFANSFVNTTLGLARNATTTQIDHYDGLAAVLDNLRRINVILVDLCRDVWTYVSMEYFRQRVVAHEVGSSAMPHKVNPIDFENAEGNLLMANALYDFLSNKLPVSRLQRDLTDSTVLRNLGVPIAHSLLALQSLMKGLDKLQLNDAKLAQDLETNGMVIAEGIQTILRREGIPGAYEKLKDFSRTGQAITAQNLQSLVDSLELSPDVRTELLSLSPHNYTGLAAKLVGQLQSPFAT